MLDIDYVRADGTKTLDNTADKLNKITTQQIENQYRVQHLIDFATKINVLRRNQPKVLNFMFRHEKHTLTDETEVEM